MRPLESAAQTLAARTVRRLAAQPVFMALESHEPGPVTAVDGSHAVLVDNGNTWVVAHRAAAATWPGPSRQVQPVVTAASPDEASRIIGESVPNAEAFAQALRERAESSALLEAIRAAPPGGLILVDGALRGLPRAPQASADEAMALAATRGVRLVAVAKRSGLERDGVPLVEALYEAGSSSPWAVAVEPGIFVARLHAAAPFAFRVDAVNVEDIGALLPSCRDAAYVGYPYPLAKAHNAVALTAGEVAQLKASLESELRRQGGGAMRAIRDFHATLDRNVPG